MDINSYNYTPHILDEDTQTALYENEDMTAYIDKGGTTNAPIFWLSAYSYAPGLDIAESFTNETAAKSVYNYIVDNYSDTPPADNKALQDIIYKYSKSLLSAVYDFADYIAISA